MPVTLQYGSCTAPSSIGSLEALQSYLQDTSRTLRKRNATQADALQQLAASLAESGPRAAALQSELNETRGFLHGSKEKILEHMVEITSLKEKAGSQEQRIQQKHNEAEQARNEAKSAKEEAEKLRQQLKEKEEQLQKQQASQPAQQQQQGPAAGPPLTEAAALSRLHILETAGMQCNPVKDQEVRPAAHMGAPVGLCEDYMYATGSEFALLVHVAVLPSCWPPPACSTHGGTYG